MTDLVKYKEWLKYDINLFYYAVFLFIELEFFTYVLHIVKYQTDQ